MGHGGHANAGKVKRDNKVSRALIYPPKAHGAEHFFPTNGLSLQPFTNERILVIGNISFTNEWIVNEACVDNELYILHFMRIIRRYQR